MRFSSALLFAVTAAIATPAIAQDDVLSPRQGVIAVAQASAEIDLGEQYDFYGPADARHIIVDVWDNRPEQAEGVLGIVMPAGLSPEEEGWGGIVTYAPTGWISNEDARSADYEALLREMQDQAQAENFELRAQGLPTVEITGWAQQPRYDSVSHALIWARELDFSDTETNALSYDLRMLGRRGVLSINFVSDIDRLPEIRAAARHIADATSFAPGSRYEDYSEGEDEAAGYGLAGLVASGAGMAVAKQAGFFAVLAKFAKPLLVGLAILLALVFAPLRRLFGRGNGETAVA